MSKRQADRVLFPAGRRRPLPAERDEAPRDRFAPLVEDVAVRDAIEQGGGVLDVARELVGDPVTGRGACVPCASSAEDVPTVRVELDGESWDLGVAELAAGVSTSAVAAWRVHVPPGHYEVQANGSVYNDQTNGACGASAIYVTSECLDAGQQQTGVPRVVAIESVGTSGTSGIECYGEAFFGGQVVVTLVGYKAAGDNLYLAASLSIRRSTLVHRGQVSAAAVVGN